MLINLLTNKKHSIINVILNYLILLNNYNF